MIKLSLSSDLFAPKLFPYLTDYSKRYMILMGSAGSAKSYFITQRLIIRACTERIRIMVCRRYGSTLRNSCFNLFKEILRSWEISPYVKINDSDMRIVFPNESEIIFLGLDDEEKLLSINNIGTVFIEEATEISKDIFEQLNLRMRGDVTSQQIIMAFNPISANHWLHDYIENPPDPSQLEYIHITYKDNPFLKDEYIRAIESLKVSNPQKWRIFGLGEWGVDSEGLVLTNWDIQDFDIDEVAKKFVHRCGLDWGYQDPTAIISSFYDESTNTIYVADEFYKTGQTLDEVYNAIYNMGLNHSKIICDSAEPRTIDYFRRKYLNTVPCVKGAGSVHSRISFLQNARIIIRPECKSFIEEVSNFSYVKNKQTGKFEEEKYTHEYSHAIDALGYAYSDMYTKGKLRALDKALLGL